MYENGPSRYVLGKRRTFVYHNPNPCEIVYYIGQRITRIIDEPGLEFTEDITCVCFSDRKSALDLVDHSCGLVDHDRVVTASYYKNDNRLNKHLVCFPRFDGFLTEADLIFLASLENPNSSSEVPGNPNYVVQSEIRALSEALEHMHSKGVSSSSLHLPVGYVWCRGESSGSTGKLKIIMLDFDIKEDRTSAQWNKIKARDVQRFGTGLDRYFLSTTVDWPQKDSFFRCFSMKLQDENTRLRMIRGHPFLMNNFHEILRILTRVYEALRSTKHGRLQLTKLMVALNSKQFKSEFMPDGEWTRQEMSPEFKKFLRGEPRCKPGDNSLKYNTKDMGDLLRFLGNLYELYYKNRFHLGFIFTEVGTYWPYLIDRLHEKIAALPERLGDIGPFD